MSQPVRLKPLLRPAFVLTGVFALATSPGRAGLRWENTVVERAAKPGEATIEVPFSFTVEGSVPVQILETGTSCGCTVAALDKRVYKPGETGIVTARFTPGERRGLQEKQLTVKSLEEGAERSTILTLKVSLPAWITLEKNRLEWAREEKNTAKTLPIATAPGCTLRLKPLDPAKTQDLKIDLRPDLDRGGYLLEVSPQEGRRPGLVPIFVEAESKDSPVASAPIILRFR